jgi:hypothetical protein
MTDDSAFRDDLGEHVDAERLALILRESGWTASGQRAGTYVRMQPPEECDHTVLIPLDPSAPEYLETMRAALADIRHLAAQGMWASNVSARLAVEPSDSFRFRVEGAASSGLISWSRGERLIYSARRILLAGAKTHIEPLSHYGNRLGRFANRYLESVLMGQTELGSYVITAYSPANGFVPISGGKAIGRAPSEVQSDAASTRGIGVSIMAATEATKEAVEHYRSTGSLSGFEDLVPNGISYEMTIAIGDMVKDSNEAEISVAWDPSLEVPPHAPASKVSFSAADADVLMNASARLAADLSRVDRVAVARSYEADEFRADAQLYAQELFAALQRHQRPQDVLRRRESLDFLDDFDVDFLLDAGDKAVAVEAKARIRPLQLQDVHRSAGLYDELRALYAHPIGLILVSRSGFTPQAQRWTRMGRSPILVSWAGLTDDESLRAGLEYAWTVPAG